MTKARDIADNQSVDTTNFVTKSNGAIEALDGSNLTGIAAGITEADEFRLNTSFTGDKNPIVVGWERNDTNFDKIGTGLTAESGGVFSFPSTGIWLVTAYFRVSCTGENTYCMGEINVTSNNSSYSTRASASSGMTNGSNDIDQTYSTSCIIDVTDTSNVKFKISQNVADNSTTTVGNSNQNRTYFTAIRLGDT